MNTKCGIPLLFLWLLAACSGGGAADTELPDLPPAECRAEACGGNGECDFEANQCACDSGYTGVECGDCAAGYVLEGGVCVPEGDIDLDPPDGPLTAIPDVPFDHLREPGDVTLTGELPATIQAGEVLAFTGQTAIDDLAIQCAGTEDNPAFIVGGTLSGSSDVFTIQGSWCYFVGTVFSAMQPRPSGDHIVFRDVEIVGSNAKNGINIGGSNIVVVGSEIHHNQRDGNDAHGVQVGQGTTDIWILDNDIHHNSGNGLQACHGCSEAPPSGVYIGRNQFHSDREVGIGLKYANNVVIEANVFHSYVAAQSGVEWCFDDGSGCGTWNSGSDGSAIVVGADGAPTGVVIVGNEVTATNNAVRIEESNGVQLLDNNFHDIAARCLALDKDGMDTVYRGNRCANADRGIFQNWRDNFSLIVDDNVFENITGPAIEYEARSVCDASTLTSNQFTSTGDVICANQVATTTAEVNALPGAAENTFE